MEYVALIYFWLWQGNRSLYLLNKYLAHKVQDHISYIKTITKKGGVRRGLMGISMCHKRTHAFSMLNFFSKMLVRIHVITIRFKKRAKGRHLQVQDMLSYMFVKYVSFKSLVDEERNFSFQSDRQWMFNKEFTEDLVEKRCCLSQVCYIYA